MQVFFLICSLKQAIVSTFSLTHFHIVFLYLSLFVLLYLLCKKQNNLAYEYNPLLYFIHFYPLIKQWKRTLPWRPFSLLVVNIVVIQ